jgi:hypothetical protein
MALLLAVDGGAVIPDGCVSPTHTPSTTPTTGVTFQEICYRSIHSNDYGLTFYEQSCIPLQTDAEEGGEASYLDRRLKAVLEI